jgi:hypothetical protein
MSNKRDINLRMYGMSKYSYRELKYFCLQYHEKKSKALNGDTHAAADIAIYIFGNEAMCQ